MHYECQREFQKYNVNAINAHSMCIETKWIPIRIECASSVNRPLIMKLFTSQKGTNLDFCIEELLAFTGLNIAMGMLRLPQVRDY